MTWVVMSIVLNLISDNKSSKKIGKLKDILNCSDFKSDKKRNKYILCTTYYF